jgi:hypothetical protein
MHPEALRKSIKSINITTSEMGRWGRAKIGVIKK